MKRASLFLVAGLLMGSLLTWSLARKDGEPVNLSAHSPVVPAPVPAPPEPALAGEEGPGPEPAPPVSAPEAAAGPMVMGFPDGPEERIARVLGRDGLSPSQKADLLLAELRQSPPAEQVDLMRHIACLYPDPEWYRYRDLLADLSLELPVREAALETLAKDRPGWLLVEVVSMVLQNPRDPLRPVANQALRRLYPNVADYDLNSYRTLSRREYQDHLSSGKAGPWEL